MKSIALSELQSRFSEVLLSGRGDASTLIELGISDHTYLSAGQRMGVYQEAYRLRMHGAMEEDFPETLELFGEEAFARLVDAYLLAHPSRSWTLAELGVSFQAFVTGSPWERRFPFLVDLVRLEWSRVLVDFSEDAVPLYLSSIANLSAAEVESVVLALSPTSSLLRLDWAVHRDRTKSLSHLLVYRGRDGEIVEVDLSEDQWALLAMISDGLSIQWLVNHLTATSSDPARVSEWFSSWVSQGIVVRVS